jgi:hypothetical protein
VALGVVLAVVHPWAPVHTKVPGFLTPVTGFELASRPEHVTGLLGAPGNSAHESAARRMRLGTRIDFVFALTYPAFYCALAAFLRVRGRLPYAAALSIYALAALMAAADLLENRELLCLCDATDAAAMAAPLRRLRVFALAKWYAIFAASGLVAVFVRRESGWWRWSAVPFAGAAVLGGVSVVHLPAIEWATLPLAAAWLITCVRAFR